MSPRSTRRVLYALTGDESWRVLHQLLSRHPELAAEAEALAEEVASEVDREAVADEVLEVLNELSLAELSARSGRQPFGYVEPVEAANELAEECLEESLDDLLRLAKAGLEEPARAVCEGVLLALHRVDVERHEALRHAPDLPRELAGFIAERWRSAEGPEKGRRRLDPELVAGELSDWGWVLSAREE